MNVLSFSKKKLVLLTFFLLGLLFLTVVVISNNQKKIYRSKAEEIKANITPPAESVLLSSDIDAKNTEILQILEEYKQANESKKQELLSILQSKTYERTQTLIKLLQKNPKLAEQKVFSSEILSQFPNEVLLEERIEKIRGKVDSLIRDDFENKRAEYETYITNPQTNQKSRLYIYDNPTFSPLSGTEIEIKQAIEITITNSIFETSSPVNAISPSISPPASPSLKIDKYILAGAENNNINVISVPPLDTTGNQKILLAFAKIKDIPNPILPSFDEIKNRINGSIKNYFEKESYGKFSLTTGDVIEKWYDLTEDQNSSSALVKILDDDNINLKNYDGGRLAFFISAEKQNTSQNSPLSWSTVGKNNYYLNDSNSIINISVISIWLPINQDWFKFHLYQKRFDDYDVSYFDETFSHEFGHSLGALHAAGVVCPDDITSLHETSFNWINTNWIEGITAKVGIGDMECNYDEYGNYYDRMGRGFFSPSFSSYVKKYFKWIDKNSDAELLEINADNSPKEYIINKAGNKGVVALQLTLNDGSSIFLENPLVPNRFSSGLLINLVSKFQSIYYVGGLNTTLKIQPSVIKVENSRNNTLFLPGQIITSEPDNIKIQVKETNEEEGTLTLNISPISNLPNKNFDANSKKERRLGMEFLRSSSDSILNIHRPESGNYRENYQIKWDQNEKIIEVKIMDPKTTQLFTANTSSLQKSVLKIAKARLIELFNTNDFSGVIFNQDGTLEMTSEEKERFRGLLIQALSKEYLSP